MFHVLIKESALLDGHKLSHLVISWMPSNPLLLIGWTIICTAIKKLALEWNIVKPLFWEAFLDKTDTIVFANTMFPIKLANYDNNLYDNASAVTQMMTLHAKKFLNKIQVLPDGHGLTVAQQLDRQNALHCNSRKIHEEFCKYFFSVWTSTGAASKSVQLTKHRNLGRYFKISAQGTTNRDQTKSRSPWELSGYGSGSSSGRCNTTHWQGKWCRSFKWARKPIFWNGQHWRAHQWFWERGGCQTPGTATTLVTPAIRAMQLKHR